MDTNLHWNWMKFSPSKMRNQGKHLSEAELLPHNSEAISDSHVDLQEAPGNEGITEIMGETLISQVERDSLEIIRDFMQVADLTLPMKEKSQSKVHEHLIIQDLSQDLVMKVAMEEKVDTEEKVATSTILRNTFVMKNIEVINEKLPLILAMTDTTRTSHIIMKNIPDTPRMKKRGTMSLERISNSIPLHEELFVNVVVSADLSGDELQECPKDISEDRHEQEEEGPIMDRGVTDLSLVSRINCILRGILNSKRDKYKKQTKNTAWRRQESGYF